MGFIGSLFGSQHGNTGGAGMNYSATGLGPTELQDVWNNTQNSLMQQQAFIRALQGQNGIGNQSEVFAQQMALAKQLQNQANGIGPNPAQAQFQQNANQVAAQTAGLIGSQKGMSPALSARLIAQQGASAGQNVAGQAAVLQAQQQMAAMQALQNQQANMANLATQQVGQQQNAISGYMQGALGQQQNSYGLQGNVNSSNANVSAQTAANQGALFGGLLNGAGAAMSMADGGMVPALMPAPSTAMVQAPNASSGPQSDVGRYLQRGAIQAPLMGAVNPSALTEGYGKMGEKKPENSPDYEAGNIIGSQMASKLAMSRGGQVIEGEQYAHQLKPVPGKASVKGDSVKNDTVPARLSPGEVILPRSVMQSEDPAKSAAAFVRAVMAKNGRGFG